MTNVAIDWAQEAPEAVPGDISSPDSGAWAGVEESGRPGSISSAPEFGDHVERDPDIWSGMAVVQGTRIPVFMIQNLYEEMDLGIDAICERYPSLSRADVHAALAYAERAPGLIAEDRRSYEESIPDEVLRS